MNSKSLLGMLTAASAVLALSACSDSAPPAGGASTTAAAPTSSAPPAASAAHNAADVTFVQGMIPHHNQAVDMAKQAAGRAGSEQVKQLAVRIEQAQGPEMAQMRGFLAAWGVPENPSGMPGMSGMSGMSGMGQGGMSGMMTGPQMQQLSQAQGAAFDRLFLQMMIAHHTGAIQMAQTELTAGQSPEAKALAQTIIDAQQSEITEMRDLLTLV